MGKIKVLSLVIVLSMVFGWGASVLMVFSEDFWYELELTKTPELFTADMTEEFINQQVENLKIDRGKRISLQNANINTRVAISVEINKKGKEKVLFSLNSQDRVPMASISKLMTALVVFDNYDLNISTQKLINAMLIESNNNAADSLAGLIDYDDFINSMNDYAEKIGLENTYFVNPTGLEPDDPEKVKNYSTAEDLVKLAKYILKNQPKIFEITADRKFAYMSTNKLLTKYPEIIGGKTGYSPAAGECLLIVLENPGTGTRFINIVLGARDRFLEMTKIINALNSPTNPPLGG
ncbi:serine hydrolase [Patescibacteria group bacterium]|nr:serine hydrolase [Patescibacteria group bacterium]